MDYFLNQVLILKLAKKNCVWWLSFIRTLSLFHTEEFNTCRRHCGVSAILVPSTNVLTYYQTVCMISVTLWQTYVQSCSVFGFHCSNRK